VQRKTCWLHPIRLFSEGKVNASVEQRAVSEEFDQVVRGNTKREGQIPTSPTSTNCAVALWPADPVTIIRQTSRYSFVCCDVTRWSCKQ
jgi:hypothetical protein